MTRIRHALPLVGILVISALLAFPLRDTIYEAVVDSGGLYCLGIEFVLSCVFAKSPGGGLALALSCLCWRSVWLPNSHHVAPARKNTSRSMARWKILRSRGAGHEGSGTYFKWLIANRLGKLAYQMLLDRESGRPRSVFAPLLGLDWEPSNELRQYLETGLHGSSRTFRSHGAGGQLLHGRRSTMM